MNKVLLQLQNVKSAVFLNAAEKEFIRFNRSLVVPSKTGSELKVLVQMPEEYYYLLLFSSLLRSLRRKFKVDIGWINVNTEFQRSGKSGFLKRNRFFERKWNKLYQSNGGKAVFSHIFYESDLNPVWVAEAEDLFMGLSDPFSLLELQYHGILIGSLIYDTYLRFKPSPTVDLKDPFLKRIMVSALHIFNRAESLLSEKKYDYLITSYSSYIQHGIMARVALARGVKVISFGDYDQLSMKLVSEFPFHSKNFTDYHGSFQRLSDSEKQVGKSAAETMLLKRFSGEKDQAITYMNSSAYHSPVDEKSKVFAQNGKKRVVVFLHCFFDSPHGYRSMLYPDFYHWIRATLKIATQSPADFYVKAHPNGVAGNDEIIEQLKKEFPEIKFLPRHTSNKQLLDEGFDLAVTVYGTLGHEFPYQGIRVLNAGDNPHVTFDFCVHPKSREEYEQFLMNIDAIPAVPADAKAKIHEFYYLHFLYPFPGKLKANENAMIQQEWRKFTQSEHLREYVRLCQNSKYLKQTDSLVFRSFCDSAELFSDQLLFVPAASEDAHLVHQWRNSESVRAQSHQTESIPIEQHLAWFEKTLSNADREIYMVIKNRKPVGMIRRDRISGEPAWKLSWLVAPELQGQGIGKAMLSCFVLENPDHYVAEIKKGNPASIRMAHEAGFEVSQDHDDYQSWTYGSKG